MADRGMQEEYDSGRMSDFERIYRTASESLERGQTLALATVVRVRGSAPRHDGARMLIWADGRIQGTIGGATLEQRVIADARRALGERRSRLERYVFNTHDDPASVGLCGGSVEVHIEVLEPESTLVVIGAGHIARPLAQMAALLGMQLRVVDDRPEFADRARFPEGAEVAQVAYDAQSEALAPLPVALTPSSYVVVATWGWDEPALAQILAADPPPAYVGLVASPTKARVLRERLMQHGLSAEAVGRIRAPVGLDLGAETPEEIALSILAEILSVRRRATGAPLHESRRKRPSPQSS